MGLFGSSKKDVAREQMRHELNLQREQQEWNVQMWNMQNEYNKPSAQLERLLDAGINPNALYGTSSVAGNADAVQPYERAHAVQMPSTGEAVTDAMAPIYNMMDAFQRLEMNSAAIKNLNQQTENAKTDVALGKQQIHYNDVTFNARVESALNAPKEQKAQIDKLISDTRIQRDTFEIFAHKSEEELKQIMQVTNNLRVDYQAKLQEIEESKQRIIESDQRIAESQSRVNLLDEQTRAQEQQRLLESYKLEFARAYGFAPGTPTNDVMFDLWQRGEDYKVVDYYLANAVHVSEKYSALADKSMVYSRIGFDTPSVDDEKYAEHELKKWASLVQRYERELDKLDYDDSPESAERRAVLLRRLESIEALIDKARTERRGRR